MTNVQLVWTQFYLIVLYLGLLATCLLGYQKIDNWTFSQFFCRKDPPPHLLTSRKRISQLFCSSSKCCKMSDHHLSSNVGKKFAQPSKYPPRFIDAKGQKNSFQKFFFLSRTAELFFNTNAPHCRRLRSIQCDQ